MSKHREASESVPVRNSCMAVVPCHCSASELYCAASATDMHNNIDARVRCLVVSLLDMGEEDYARDVSCAGMAPVASSISDESSRLFDDLVESFRGLRRDTFARTSREATRS